MIISHVAYGENSKSEVNIRVREEEIASNSSCTYPVAIYFGERDYVMLTQEQLESLHFQVGCALHEIDMIKEANATTN